VKTALLHRISALVLANRICHKVGVKQISASLGLALHQWSGFDVRSTDNRALASERQIQSSTEINILLVVL
jgi:hypothetical protein